jgi:hypothetical protein
MPVKHRYRSPVVFELHNQGKRGPAAYSVYVAFVPGDLANAATGAHLDLNVSTKALRDDALSSKSSNQFTGDPLVSPRWWYRVWTHPYLSFVPSRGDQVARSEVSNVASLPCMWHLCRVTLPTLPPVRILILMSITRASEVRQHTLFCGCSILSTTRKQTSTFPSGRPLLSLRVQVLAWLSSFPP